MWEGLAEPAIRVRSGHGPDQPGPLFPPTFDEEPGPGVANRAFPSDALTAVRMEGRVRAAEVQLSGLSLEGFSTAVFVGDGAGRVEPFQARLYGGEVRGAAAFDARAGGPILSLTGSADGVDLEPLATALFGEPGLTGSGTFDVELSGTGGHMEELLSTSLGSIEFALRDGAVRGVNLNHALCAVYNRVQDYPRPAPAAVDAHALPHAARNRPGH